MIFLSVPIVCVLFGMVILWKHAARITKVSQKLLFTVVYKE